MVDGWERDGKVETSHSFLPSWRSVNLLGIGRWIAVRAYLAYLQPVTPNIVCYGYWRLTGSSEIRTTYTHWVPRQGSPYILKPIQTVHREVNNENV